MSGVVGFVSRNAWSLFGVAGIPTVFFFAFDKGSYRKRMERAAGVTAAMAIPLFVMFRSLDPRLSNTKTLDHVVQTLGPLGAMMAGGIAGIRIVTT